MKKIITIFMTLLFIPCTYANTQETTLFTINHPNSDKERKDIVISDKSSTYYFQLLKQVKENLDTSLNSGANQDIDNDKIFYEFQKKYEGIVNIMQETNVDDIQNFGCDRNIDARKNKVPAVYYENKGIELKCKEDTSVYSVNWTALKGAYSPYLSDTYKQWLTFLSTKNDVTITNNKLNMPLEDIRKNIVYLENFADNNPDFAAINDVQYVLDENIKYYTAIFTRTYSAFDSETGVLNSEYKDSYEAFLNENPDSKYYIQIKDLYEHLQMSGFRETAVLKAWYRNNGGFKRFKKPSTKVYEEKLIINKPE